MNPEDSPEPAALAVRGPFSASNAAAYLRRALRLRCPVCGEHPIFLPWRRVRSVRDWLTPLEGCPRCRYRYERESGYFLLATWVVNYLIVGGLALAVWFVLAIFTSQGALARVRPFRRSEATAFAPSAGTAALSAPAPR